MTAAPKTIGIDGRKYRTLDQGSTVCAYSMQPVKLEQPAYAPVCNSTQPAAPAGYAWPHLSAPARELKTKARAA